MGQNGPVSVTECIKGWNRWILIELDSHGNVSVQSDGLKRQDIYDVMLESAVVVRSKID